MWYLSSVMIFRPFKGPSLFILSAIFCIDMFSGTWKDKQKILVKFQESSLSWHLSHYTIRTYFFLILTLWRQLGHSKGWNLLSSFTQTNLLTRIITSLTSWDGQHVQATSLVFGPFLHHPPSVCIKLLDRVVTSLPPPPQTKKPTNQPTKKAHFKEL